MRGLAYAAQHSDSVFGTGTLDVARYGHVLQVAAARRRPRRGRGRSTGCTTSRRVTTSIKRGEYKQTFSLARNGLISTVPTVPA